MCGSAIVGGVTDGGGGIDDGVTGAFARLNSMEAALPTRGSLWGMLSPSPMKSDPEKRGLQREGVEAEAVGEAYAWDASWRRQVFLPEKGRLDFRQMLSFSPVGTFPVLF
jgi:hypothetical protein